jgi:hypothetical protein
MMKGEWGARKAAAKGAVRALARAEASAEGGPAAPGGPPPLGTLVRLRPVPTAIAFDWNWLNPFAIPSAAALAAGHAPRRSRFSRASGAQTPWPERSLPRSPCAIPPPTRE